MASLGCSEQELVRLAGIYWYTIEFGLCFEEDKLKVYGAGILGSAGELEYCLTDKPEIKRFDPYDITEKNLEFIINRMQPFYYAIDSFASVKNHLQDYCSNIQRPFDVAYDELRQEIIVDAKIRTRDEFK